MSHLFACDGCDDLSEPGTVTGGFPDGWVIAYVFRLVGKRRETAAIHHYCARCCEDGTRKDAEQARQAAVMAGSLPGWCARYGVTSGDASSPDELGGGSGADPKGSKRGSRKGSALGKGQRSSSGRGKPKTASRGSRGRGRGKGSADPSSDQNQGGLF